MKRCGQEEVYAYAFSPHLFILKEKWGAPPHVSLNEMSRGNQGCVLNIVVQPRCLGYREPSCSVQTASPFHFFIFHTFGLLQIKKKPSGALTLRSLQVCAMHLRSETVCICDARGVAVWRNARGEVMHVHPRKPGLQLMKRRG